MFTTTTELDSATANPSVTAPRALEPSARNAADPPAVTSATWSGTATRIPRGSRAQIELDADLEQQQHDAHVGKDLDLMAVGDVAGRERTHGEADDEVAEDRGEPDPPARHPGERGGEQLDADLEDGERFGHAARVVD